MGLEEERKSVKVSVQSSILTQKPREYFKNKQLFKNNSRIVNQRTKLVS